MSLFGKLFASFALMAAVSVLASETPNCSNHCSGTTLYSNGYKVCYGSDCVCEYNETPNSPQCPAPSQPDPVDPNGQGG